MAVIETTPRASIGTQTSPFAAFFQAIRDWNDTRVTRSALNKLSDRELDDIGLTRGDIDRI